MQRVLSLCGRGVVIQDPAVSRDAERRSLDYIIDHYLRECYAKRTAARGSELAERLARSRSYVSRWIPKTLGKTLLDVLRERQLQNATCLLRTTQLTINEVAAHGAFGDRSTLYRHFRKAFGMTPTEYRLKSQITPLPRLEFPDNTPSFLASAGPLRLE